MKYLVCFIVYLIFFWISCDEEKTKDIIIEESEPITDYEGHSYKTVKIGDQIWMAENLKTSHYRNGEWATNYCYGNDTAHILTYGRLYTWSVVIDSRGLAPAGWHIPSKAEWEKLVDLLGGTSEAGGRLKEAGQIHWQSPNTGATNESLFSALPGGMYGFWGDFQWIGEYTVFATSTDVSVPGHPAVCAIKIDYNSAQVIFGDFHPLDAVSVRCVKD